MKKKTEIFRRKGIIFCLAVISALVVVGAVCVPAQAVTAPEPVVAIHVSELTQALETMPAVSPTPTGSGTTGYEWWYPTWHYFVAYESLKEALSSEGTPFVEISDADIAAGHLLYLDGSPRYPIMISLASEAVADNEIAPLRDYVAAGGYLFIGSSAFTRNPDGTARGDFAFANEMGLHVASPIFQNWYENLHFSKIGDHRLTAHIPAGSLSWRMPHDAEEIPLGVSPSHLVHDGHHYMFRISAVSGTNVLANGDSGPVLTTRPYGSGNFVYHGAFQPFIGHGVYDPSMYAYLIYRRAIEWAFETFNLPIVKLSPWQYDYDAAFVVRHDFENNANSIRSIESSAAFENSVGARGDYYFCTGTLRDEMLDQSTVVSSIRRAVTNYGATIGSHNGGLRNPRNASLTISDFDYWHWGPDEALDVTPPGYTSGKEYAQVSVELSFLDIEGWLSGVDNGRAGCGLTGDCPRLWAAPYFNSTREDSYDILASSGASSSGMGEQKIGPLPHWTMSYEIPGMRYPTVSEPASDWFVGAEIPGAIEWGHTTETMQAAVDFYHNIGGLINLYGHESSTAGNIMGQYVTYSVSKPRMWVTNAAEIADWWQARSAAIVTPTYSVTGDTVNTQATITGAIDPETAIEVAIPNGSFSNLQVSLDGAPAGSNDYRIIGNTVKVRVGSSIAVAEVQYTTDTPADNPVPAITTLSPSSATEGDPAFTLTVNGTNFISGSVVRWNGLDRTTTYVSPTQLTASITAADIATAGTASVTVFNPTPGGGISNAQVFTITVADNPVPAITTLSPSSATEGDPAFTLTVNGTNFISGSVVRWNGLDRTTTYVSPTQLTASITAADIATAGTASVTVFNPTPGGGISNAQVFIINSTLTGSWTQTDWSGGEGQVLWADATRFDSATSIDYSTSGEISLVSTSSVLFADDFTRLPDDPDPLSPWIVSMGTWTVADGFMQGSGTRLEYSYAYIPATPQWNDYMVQGSIQMPAGSFGGGIGGRLDPATGAHYGAWVYPAGSPGGSNVLKLWKFQTWTDINSTSVPIQQVSLPDVGTGWHTLQMTFIGNRILVYYDGELMIDVTDNNYDSTSPYLSGGISLDWEPFNAPYTITVDDVSVVALPTYGSSGTLISSAFDGGEGVQWQTVTWDGAVGGGTSVCVRTRTANAVDELASALWSDCYNTSGSAVVSENLRWIQYELELTSSDPLLSPFFDEIRITYTAGGSVPVIDSLTPASAAAGGPDFPLIVNGSGFLTNSVVRWNGLDRTTTYVSPTQLTASITAADIATAGTASVTVFNPAPGGGISNAQVFTITVPDNPVPATTSLSPASVTAGGSAFTLTVNGVNFIASSVVRWNGTDRTTTYVSPTQLTASITAADIATAGTASVTVFNPSPGGGISNAQVFTITVPDNPVPATTSMSPSSVTAGGSAFTLTVNGVNFIASSVVRWNGTDRTTTFVSSTRLAASITAADIATAGTASVTVFNPSPGGGISNTQVFTIAGPDNPVPATTSMSPSSVTAGGSAFTLTVNGVNFIASSVVRWNGLDRTTTYVSPTQLTASITTADIATAGTASVTVFNPAPGGGISNVQTFIINSPLPAITSLSPSSATAGGPAFTLTVNGVNFTTSSVVRWNGTDRTTTYISPTQLTASITAADIATAGTASVTVFNPAPGGGISNAQTFIINSPLPAITSLSPSSATAGGPAFTLTVNGVNFTTKSVVRWNGLDRTTTYVSSTQLTASITAADIATAGTASVAVFNSRPRGGISNVQTFIISSPLPAAITSLSPTSATAGGPAFTLTINGVNFITSSVVRWNGLDRTTTYVSSTQLTATITAADIATVGTASVTVFNPAPGGGISNSQVFTITVPGTDLFVDDFNRPPDDPDPLSPWIVSMGTWTVADGFVQGSGTRLEYSYAYISPMTQWTDYSVQGSFQMPTRAFGGGIGGRLDPATGAHYGAWVYPDKSWGGSNVLKLWKFQTWTDVDSTSVPMQQVNLPDVGTGWHTLQMTFIGNRILVYYDGELMIDVTDNNYGSTPPYLSGGISLDWEPVNAQHTVFFDDISVVSE